MLPNKNSNIVEVLQQRALSHPDRECLIFMGDGIHDVKILKNCLFGITPKNARIEAKEASDFITHSMAGEGAVLDACIEIKKKYID